MLTLLPLPPFALLALLTFPFPSHPLLELERREFFGVARRLGEISVIELPEAWE